MRQRRTTGHEIDVALHLISGECMVMLGRFRRNGSRAPILCVSRLVEKQ